jgi:hypothetical protein
VHVQGDIARYGGPDGQHQGCNLITSRHTDFL